MFETPMRLHYSQTPGFAISAVRMFETPMRLHYSQTLVFRGPELLPFETPMRLHYSQTAKGGITVFRQFETPMRLHYSQTMSTLRCGTQLCVSTNTLPSSRGNSSAAAVKSSREDRSNPP